jgi:hypothetical protein
MTEESGFDFQWGQETFLCSRRVEIDSGAPTSVQLVPKALSSGVRLPGREADHSLSLRVRIRGAPPPFITHLHDVILNEAQEQEEVSPAFHHGGNNPRSGHVGFVVDKVALG